MQKLSLSLHLVSGAQWTLKCTTSLTPAPLSPGPWTTPVQRTTTTSCTAPTGTASLLAIYARTSTTRSEFLTPSAPLSSTDSHHPPSMFSASHARTLTPPATTAPPSTLWTKPLWFSAALSMNLPPPYGWWAACCFSALLLSWPTAACSSGLQGATGLWGRSIPMLALKKGAARWRGHWMMDWERSFWKSPWPLC